ncbi:DMT family transporter [Candidatus Rariloculus sp.]|uniref:DMT family transporter n=1 Tax=Candidatus Rariloculus sp. TaxID=3101265 RepID=UPI003D13A88A
MHSSMLARVQILLGAALFSTGGVAIKLASLSGWQVAGFRAAAAAAFIFVLLPGARRGLSWRTALVAVPWAATLVLYTLANKETTAANAIFLQDTAPFYLLILGPLLLGERIVKSDLAFLGALVLGAALIFLSTSEPLATAPRPVLGNVFAVAAGATWALALAGLRWIARRPQQSNEDPLAVVGAGCVLAFVVCAAYAFPVSSVRLLDWGIVLYLGLFQIVVAYVFIARGLRRVPVFEVSLLMLLEPALSVLWAWLVLAETPPGAALVGCGIILGATLTHTVFKARAIAR